MDCREIQDIIFKYLSITIDPYDFAAFVPEFAEEFDIDGDPEYPDDLTKPQFKQFAKWLIDEQKGDEYVRDDPMYAPAYLTLDAEKKLPAGTWLIHFTNKAGIQDFQYGTTIEGMALSVYKTKKDRADCKKNLTQDVGPGEIVFGFAFLASERRILDKADKYGKHAVLFQCDCAITAFHYGDEERQVIFPLCSEYNLIMLHNVEDGLVIETANGADIDFESIQALIDYEESNK